MGIPRRAASKQKLTRTQTLTTEEKILKNKTLKKAKTNSKELASVTTRQAETDWRGIKWKNGRVKREGKRKQAVVRVF